MGILELRSSSSVESMTLYRVAPRLGVPVSLVVTEEDITTGRVRVDNDGRVGSDEEEEAVEGSLVTSSTEGEV